MHSILYTHIALQFNVAGGGGGGDGGGGVRDPKYRSLYNYDK